MKYYRNEWKYLLSNQDLALLRSRLSGIMELDPHTPSSGKYRIHSLYFDDYTDNSLYCTGAGIPTRFKWRIRYYNDDLSYIALEKKEKLEGRTHKKYCPITLDEYHAIVSGNILDIFYDTDKKLVKEFTRDVLLYHFHPKIIIDYERIAYVEEITNVRITFDMNISASYDIEHFLDRNYIKYYIQPVGMNLLEIKFYEIFPSYIRNIVESFSFQQVFFSKYYYGRRLLDSYMR